MVDLNQESKSTELTEPQKAISSSKTNVWFEEVITEENTGMPSEETNSKSSKKILNGALMLMSPLVI